MRGNLENAFADVCGDTFCGGDYNPIRPLTLTCSVKLSDGTLGSCLWTFAGAYDSIAKTTGRVTNHNHLWKCALPVTGMYPADLMILLNAPGRPDALHRALPNNAGTIYDHTGGWTAPLWLLLALVVPLLAVGAYVGRPAFLEDQLAPSEPALPRP